MKNENESAQNLIITRSMLKRMRENRNTNNSSNKKHKVIDTNVTENNDNNLKRILRKIVFSRNLIIFPLKKAITICRSI